MMNLERILALILWISLVSCSTRLMLEKPTLVVSYSGSKLDVAARDGCWRHQENSFTSTEECFAPTCPLYMCKLSSTISVRNGENLRLDYSVNMNPVSATCKIVRQTGVHEFIPVADLAMKEANSIQLPNLEPGEYVIYLRTTWGDYGSMNYEIHLRITAS